MPLIIEDGSGVEGANSYGAVAEADAFFADRGIPDWAGAGATNSDKEGLLIQAADFMNSTFRPRGEPLLVGHTMGFPTLAYDGVPAPVKYAQFYLAREAATKPLGSALGERLVTSERKQLEGVGEKEVHYAEGPAHKTTFNSIVVGLLAPYVYNPSSGIQQAKIGLA